MDNHNGNDNINNLLAGKYNYLYYSVSCYIDGMQWILINLTETINECCLKQMLFISGSESSWGEHENASRESQEERWF